MGFRSDHRTTLAQLPPCARTCLDLSLANNQPLLPLMDEDVGNDRGSRRPEPFARFVILRFEDPEFLSARRCGEQFLQFLFSLLKRFRRRHGNPLQAALSVWENSHPSSHHGEEGWLRFWNFTTAGAIGKAV